MNDRLAQDPPMGAPGDGLASAILPVRLAPHECTVMPMPGPLAREILARCQRVEVTWSIDYREPWFKWRPWKRKADRDRIARISAMLDCAGWQFHIALCEELARLIIEGKAPWQN